MGRTKTVGIYRSSTGYNVDKQYRNTGIHAFDDAVSKILSRQKAG